MALIPCKECGKEISNKAVTCPNCGIPIPRMKYPHPEKSKGLYFKPLPVFCRKCRTSIKYGQRFCETCGTYFPCHECNTLFNIFFSMVVLVLLFSIFVK
ncbi:zinc ribbon domain-containing protein [Nitrospina gracilis]|nr:zinc ribbon domain-containing protein [Nitrospina gracilis]